MSQRTSIGDGIRERTVGVDEVDLHLLEAREEGPRRAGHDRVLTMTPPEIQDPFLDDHRGTVIIDGAGHRVQQEAPEQVDAALLGFLDELHEGNRR